MGRSTATSSKAAGANGPRSLKNGTLRVSKPAINKNQSSTTSSSTKGQATGGAGKKESGPNIGKHSSDRSLLNFPYDIRLSGFSSLQNAVTKGSPRTKQLLQNECDFIMECRVCRNLFRTVPNFMTHKLNYCKQPFDATLCIGLSNLIQTKDNTCEIHYEVDPDLILNDSDDNLTEDRLKPRSAADFYEALSVLERAKEKIRVKQPSSLSENNSNNTRTVRLKVKPLVECSTGSVVLQQKVTSDPSICDTDNAFINPFGNISKKDTAVLGPDGKILYTGSGKGIENIVSKLFAKLQKQNEDNQQKIVNSNSGLTCDICKTVFDSEKAVRQHKRESLNCGKNWPFKSPVKNGESSSISSQSSRENPQESSRKLLSPVRRQSFRKSFQSPPRKRSLALSPVKKIKMKYSKLDSSSGSGASGVENQVRLLRCSRCSESFTSSSKLSMHMAQCRGSLDYNFLRRMEPPTERISISARHDFVKSKPSSSSPNCNSQSPICLYVQQHVNEEKLVKSNPLNVTATSVFRTSTESRKDSESEILPSILKSQEELSQQYQGAGVDSSEVNNNKQYNVSSKSLSNSSQSFILSNPRESSVKLDLPSESKNSMNSDGDANNDFNNESEVNSQDVDTDSGVSSECHQAEIDTTENGEILNASPLSDRNAEESETTTKVKKEGRRGKGRPRKITFTGQKVSARPEGNALSPKKQFHLRKAVRSRARKSARLHLSSLQVQAGRRKGGGNGSR